MHILPFFVYGTLLPGQPNYTIWKNSVVSLQPAFFGKGKLFDLGAYPMLVESGKKSVKGALVTVNSSDYKRVVRELDTLEAFDPARPERCFFRRLIRPVFLAGDIQRQAWVYLGLPKFVTGAKLIESGDWITHSAAASTEIAAWWNVRGRSLFFGDSE